MTTSQPTLYDEVIKISEDYFGPAAPRFMTRLINYHLHKEPNELNRTDIKALSTWARLAIAMITEDETVIDEFAGRLQLLSDRPKPALR